MTKSDERSQPLRHLLLRAGGGRASVIIQNQTLKTFSPTVQNHLKKIYRSLTAYSNVPPANPDKPPLGSYEEFQAWFESPAANALAPPPKHNLSYPLSNYYISSSHNTYLSGNQVYGAASADAYKNVLLRGCRCLEIDVWDGEGDNSSVSSSDYEDLQLPEAKEQKEQKEDKREGRKRDRANSALRHFTHRVKDTAQTAIQMKSPGRSSKPDHHTGSAEHPSPALTQTQSLEVPTITELKELKSEPRVYHGYTLTTGTPFRTVCHAIKESAFDASDLPVIVSLEVHCSLEQQEVMVDIMRSVFKGYLVDISDASEDSINKLPSPKELRNKILIKVKWTPNPETGESNNPLEQVETAENDEQEDPTSPEKRKQASKILQALSELGVYTRAYKFKHFAQPEAKIPTHVFSLSEGKVEDFHKDPQHGPALFEHNRDFLMRVYPLGLRINSSNVEPCFLWRQGTQMVALNWQRLDKGTMLNEGMFAGEEGWVLKPDGFRGAGPKHLDAAKPAPEPARHLLDLEIEVLAGQNLPLPPGRESSHLGKMRPYLKIQLHVDTHGPPGQGSSDASESHATLNSKYNPHFHRKTVEDDQDEAARKLKRKSKTAKSSDPDFGSEIMEWKGIHDVVDELSFLRIKVNDDHAIGKDDLIAWACIKLNRLRTGYRIVHLLDSTGAPCDGALLLRIRKTMRA